MTRVSSKTCALGRARPFAGRRRGFRQVAPQAVALETPMAADLNENVEASERQEMYAQFDQLLEGHVVDFRPGTVVQGQVVDWNRKYATVEIGGKGHAHVATTELSCAPIKNVRLLHRSSVLPAGLDRCKCALECAANKL